MTIEEIKAIPIAAFLARMGYEPARRRGDMVILTAARLRKKATDESIENSSYKLFLTDTTTGRPLNCWECLVMEFNGKRITI